MTLVRSGIAALLLGGTALAGSPPPAREPAGATARKVILFLADAGGLPTLSAASIYGHGAPHRLFIQSMPRVALSETSSATRWVTDSAAGMTAIVTGQKTQNGVLAQSASAVRGEQDGAPLRTILEYAEERGLSTGVVTNSSVLSATPAACYAHVNDRKDEPGILHQLMTPRAGDGVDVVIGSGRVEVTEAAGTLGLTTEDALARARLPLFDSLDNVPPGARRAAVLFDGGFDLEAATARAIDVLSHNGQGYFLMVESDTHTDAIARGLQRMLAMDRAVRHAAERGGSDTLILFTADHSYDFRIRSGQKGTALLPGDTPHEFGKDQETVATPTLRRDDSHTGEDVIVAAQGPGSDRVHGFLVNTDLFDIMMRAYGWDAADTARASAR
jgi:alkaline phosphatase